VELPITYAFQTSQGTCGLLQIVGISQEEGSIDLQYRIFSYGTDAQAPRPELHPPYGRELAPGLVEGLQDMQISQGTQGSPGIGEFPPGRPDVRTRARYKQAQETLSVLTNALELYRLDQGSYPEALANLMKADTGPYVKEMPSDPFGRPGDNDILYATDGHIWILASRGPDGDFDVDPQVYLESGGDPSFSEKLIPASKYLYDPDTGSAGGGDIFVTSQSVQGESETKAREP
jgi:hypothetical protein